MEFSREDVIVSYLRLPHWHLTGQESSIADTACHAPITDFGIVIVTRGGGSIRSASVERSNDARGTYCKEADVFSFADVAIDVRRKCWYVTNSPSHRSLHSHKLSRLSPRRVQGSEETSVDPYQFHAVCRARRINQLSFVSSRRSNSPLPSPLSNGTSPSKCFIGQG